MQVIKGGLVDFNDQINLLLYGAGYTPLTPTQTAIIYGWLELNLDSIQTLWTKTTPPEIKIHYSSAHHRDCSDTITAINELRLDCPPNEKTFFLPHNKREYVTLDMFIIIGNQEDINKWVLTLETSPWHWDWEDPTSHKFTLANPNLEEEIKHHFKIWN